MKKLLLIVFILFAPYAYSQNAFYDMQRLMHWYSSKDSDAKTEESKDIMATLLFYADDKNYKLTDTITNLFLYKVYHKANTLYTLSAKQKITKDSVVARAMRTETYWPEALKEDRNTLIGLEKERKVLHDQTDRFKQATKTGDSAAMLNEAFSLAKAIVNNSVFKKVHGLSFDTATAAADLQAAPDSMIVFIDSLAESAKALLNETVLQKESAIFDSVLQLPADTFRKVFPQINISGKEKLKQITELQAELRQHQAAREEHLSEKKAELKDRHQTVYAAPNLMDLNFPNQSDIIDAVAIYLARRTKQEATLLFIEKLNKAILSNQLAQELFPQTWQVMQEMESFVSPRFGAKWRNAIATDYIHLPQNIVASRYIKTRLIDSVMYQYFADAVTFAGYVGNKYSFLDIIRTFHNNPLKMQGKWTSIGVDVLYIINSELRDSSRTTYRWVAPETFLSLGKEEMLCLYDLVKIKYEDKVGPSLKKLLHLPGDLPVRVKEYQLFYAELLTMLKQFNDIQMDAAKKNTDGTVIAGDGFWDAQRSFIDFLLAQNMVRLKEREKKALQLCKSGFYIYDYLSNKNYAAAADHVLRVVGSFLNKGTRELINLEANDVAVLKKKYTPLYFSVAQLNRRFADLTTLQQLIAEANTRPPDEVMNAAYIEDQYSFSDPLVTTRLSKNAQFDLDSALAVALALTQQISQEYALVKPQLHTIINDKNIYLFKKAELLNADLLNAAHRLLVKENSNYFKWLSDFAGLLTEITATKKSDELATVIESYALPPGSYRLKRNANFSIDLNAFTGFYLGAEKIQGDRKWAPVYGVTAPIGFAFSWGLSKEKGVSQQDNGDLYVANSGKLKRRTQKSITLDFTVVDLGAVVSYRFSGESKGLPNKASWDQLLSLGANLRYGIKGTPFCLGIGVQRSPKLRSFDNIRKDAWRGHLSASFDLPLINIYRKR